MNFMKLSTGAAVALGMGLLSLPAANANVILTYTGNDFTSVSGPYTKTDKVTASITLANPLGANLNLSGVTPLAFTIMDGVQTLSDPNQLNVEIKFSTDASGAITMWIVDMVSILSPAEIETENIFGDHSSNVHDNAEDKTGFTGSNGDNPGTWTTTSAAVPEPPTVSVLGAGLLGLGLFWWRRRQKLDLAQ